MEDYKCIKCKVALTREEFEEYYNRCNRCADCEFILPKESDCKKCGIHLHYVADTCLGCSPKDPEPKLGVSTIIQTYRDGKGPPSVWASFSLL